MNRRDRLTLMPVFLIFFLPTCQLLFLQYQEVICYELKLFRHLVTVELILVAHCHSRKVEDAELQLNESQSRGGS